jgi:hypothetical protein
MDSHIRGGWHRFGRKCPATSRTIGRPAAPPAFWRYGLVSQSSALVALSGRRKVNLLPRSTVDSKEAPTALNDDPLVV